MNDIVNLIVNNGIAVVVVAYFIYRDCKYQNELIKTMTHIQDNLDVISNKLKGEWLWMVEFHMMVFSWMVTYH